MTAQPLIPRIPANIPDSFTTERLIIRAPRAGDGAEINAAVLETYDALHRWMPWAGDRPSVAESESFAQKAGAAYAERSDLPYLLFLKGTTTLVGCSGLTRMDWKVPRFEIGYWCRSRFEGKGYITEAVRAINRFALDVLKAQRVEIHCSHANERSRRVAERAGFALEAKLARHGREPNGELRDTMIYVQLAP
jgi:RimJ/RimL family protein N-acetyltransferase